jgi:hypothetical protein
MLRFWSTRIMIRFADFTLRLHFGSMAAFRPDRKGDMSMKNLISALCAVAVTASCTEAASDVSTLDLSGVKAVIVTGDASSLSLTTSGTLPYAGRLKSFRKGWFSGWQSGWFFDDCAGASSMRLDGDRLLVHMVSSSWYSLSDCVVDASINVPESVDVSIDQSAALLRLEGSFSNLKVSGSALDVALDGHASKVSLTGAAMRARLSYTRLDNNERVDMSSSALMADLEFGSEAKVHYTVTGDANFIDSRLVNTPDAGIKVHIDGSFIRATIR